MLWRSRPTGNEPIVHSGVLFKRGSGRLFGRRNWKTRHFVLTRTKLQYFTFENGKFRGEVDLSPCSPECLEIMPLSARKTGRSASTIWRFEIRTPNGRRLLMAAPTEREMNVWIHRLTIVLRNLRPQIDAFPVGADIGRVQVDVSTESEKTEVASQSPRRSSRSSSPLSQNEEDHSLTQSWKSSTDFQNFVAQPRRSLIFGRQAGEIRKLYHRHSIGEFAMPQEHVELRTDQRASPEDPEHTTSTHEATPEDDGFPSEDAAATLQRRFSTGSRYLTSELSTLATERDSDATEREDALIRDLLASLVANNLEERRANSSAITVNESEKLKEDSNDDEQERGRDSHAHTATASASSSPRLSPVGPEDDRDSLKASFDLPSEKNVDGLAGSYQESNFAPTSPCSQTAAGMQCRGDPALDNETSMENCEERPSLFRRLSLKLGRRRSSVTP